VAKIKHIPTKLCQPNLTRKQKKLLLIRWCQRCERKRNAMLSRRSPCLRRSCSASRAPPALVRTDNTAAAARASIGGSQGTGHASIEQWAEPGRRSKGSTAVHAHPTNSIISKTHIHNFTSANLTYQRAHLTVPTLSVTERCNGYDNQAG
jgi:hypothetical protein